MTNDSIVNVVFAVYDKLGDYSSKTATSIVSMMENTSIKPGLLNVYILYDSTLSSRNKELLRKTVERYNQNIFFCYVDIPESEYNFYDLGVFSPGTLFRLKIAELINCRKIIYLDSDVIVNLDIVELFNENLNGKSIGAVLEVELFYKSIKDIDFNNKSSILKELEINVTKGTSLNFFKYFNAGVLLLDLDQIRKKYNMYRMCMGYLKNNKKAPYADQFALNMLFKNDCEYLNEKYNRWSKRGETKCIYHFACWNEKPWININSRISLLYWKYFYLTPWCKNVEFLLLEYSKTKTSLELDILIQPIYSRKLFIKNVIFRVKQELYMWVKNKWLIKEK